MGVSRLGLTAPEAVGHQESHLRESRAAPALGPRLVRQDEGLRPEAQIINPTGLAR
jgi:hypothetical protein